MLQPNSNLSATSAGYSRPGPPNMAIGEYIQTVTVANDAADAYNKRGVAYCENGKYDEGIAQFNKAIVLVPECADVYYNRGTVYFHIGEFEKAITDYTAALKLQPNYANAYYNRGNAYYVKNELDKAIADYTEVLKLRPKVAEYYYTRGEAWLLARSWEEAKTDLTAALLQDVDVAGVFHKTYGSIDAFEQKIEDRLPKEIVVLLTPRSEPFEIDKEARIALGMKYYGEDILSSGLASKLAGIPRVEFILLMGDYGLSPFGDEEEYAKSGF